MKNEKQTIYINLDDSGKLTKKESVCIYGGIVFFSKREKDKFITQFRSILDDMKCNYCDLVKSETCTGCPEIKHNIIEKSHKRRILNYIKNYCVVSCIISNVNIYDHIMANKASRGRYLDFAIRRVLKEMIREFIKNGKIDPNKPVELILNIDEQTTKSNGYYNLKDGLIEDLIHGISNFDYNKIHKPILNNSLTVTVNYQKSEKCYVVQAADFIAGTVRRSVLNNSSNPIELIKELEFIDFKLFLP